MEELIFFSIAFILGLSGSLHCVSMCGPIILTIFIKNNKKNKILLQNFSYQLGRIFCYILLGLISNIINYSFFIIGFQNFFSIIIGIIMIIYIFIPKINFLQKNYLKFYNLFLQKIRFFLLFFIKKKNFFRFFIIGFLNGFLPCGLVYTALSFSLINNKLLFKLIFMLYFGLGTLPLTFITIFFGNFINFHFKKKILKIIPILIFLTGTLLLLRGFKLNIPFFYKKNCH